LKFGYAPRADSTRSAPTRLATLVLTLAICILAPETARSSGFVRSVEYVEITLGSGQASGVANLTKGQTVANAVPFATSTADSAANGFGNVFTDVFLTAGSPPSVTVQRDLTPGTVTVGVYVVEFDSSYVRVQTGTFAIASGSAAPVTAPLAPSVDLTRAALVFYHRNDFPNGANGYNVVSVEGTFSAVNQLQFQRNTGGAATLDGHWYVFEALNVAGSYVFDVQTKSFNFTAAGGTSTALGTGVLSVSSFVTGSYRTAESNDHANTGSLRLYLSGCAGSPSSCTTVSAERQTSNTTVWVTAYVIHLTGGGRVQRGTFNYTSSGGGASLQTAILNPALDATRTVAWNGFGVPGIMRSNEGSGDQMATGHQLLKIINGTTVSGSHAFTGFTAVGTWEAIEWPTLCCALDVTTTATTVTVTAPGSYELQFDTAAGGGINQFYDLAEDPARAQDLAGGLSNERTLLNVEIQTSPSSTWYSTDENNAGAKLDVLEATPLRARVRQESFLQSSGGALLGGIKAIGDYSVYGTGRVATRWTENSTVGISYFERDVALASHWTGTGSPGFKPCAETLPCWSAPGAGTDDFVLQAWNIAGKRTDFLSILSADWAQATQLQSFGMSGAPDEWWWSGWAQRSGTPSTPATQSWNLLTYFQPTSLVDNTDAAVTSRSTDYRSPDALAVLIGQPWTDASENTSGDDFNEAEGVYVLTFDPAQPTIGLRVDIDGSAAVPRRSPFFKIRQWRSLADPPSVTLAGTTLVNDVDFRAEVKPIARAYFAQDLSWHSTLESQAALDTTPDVGSPGTISGTVTFVSARYGNGAQVGNTTSFFSFPTAGNFDPARGAIELWYKPTYASNDGVGYTIGGYRVNGSNFWLFEKDAANVLRFRIRNAGNISEIVAAAGSFSWRANDWVHLRFEWDDSLSIATQLKIFVNGVEPNPGGGTGVDYTSASSVAASFQIGCQTTTGGSPGIYDEVRVYGGSSTTPSDLARGGLLTSPSEYLGSQTNNASFPFTAVNGTRQGEYLYFGSDSKFRGLNVSLATKGVGAVDLQWEFWNGAAWTSLEGGGFTDETNQLTKDGTVFWTGDPFNWAPYSINGGPDLYFVRAYLASGAYTTVPVESLVKTDILLFQYCKDITSLAQRLEIGKPAATAVELVHFEARGIAGAIELDWETASELHNLGFLLYRSESERGTFDRITAAVIPGLGSSPVGARYRYVDQGALPGRTYSYELEDIETSGRRKRHGPVSAMPAAGGPDAASAGDGAGAGMVFGAPETGAFRVLENSARGLVVELRTEGFSWEQGPDGAITISVPGLTDEGEPGSPQVPVKRAWIEVGSPRAVAIASIEEEDVHSFSLRPRASEAPEIEASPRGTVRAGRTSRAEGARFREGSTYPEAWARILSVGYQGEQRKIRIELAPLRWDARTGELQLARRLVVRLVFTGPSAGPRENRRGGDRPVAKRLLVRERGIYGVSFDDLMGAGGRRRAVSARSLNVSRLGASVPFHVEPDDGTFGPGSALYFTSEGESLNPYGRDVVYEVSLSGGGLPMEVISAAPRSARPAEVLGTVAREENRYYQAGLVDAFDPWLWDVLLAPVEKSYDFDLPSLSSSPSTSAAVHPRFSVWLQGASDFPADPDHHVRVSINGTVLADGLFDGKEPFQIRSDVPEGVLRVGANHLSIENVGDTGAEYSMVLLDRFEVRYPSVPELSGDSWEATAAETGTVELKGLGGGSVLVDVDTAGRARWLRSASTTSAGARFSVEAGRTYRATRSPRKPLVADVAPSRLRSATRGADYIVIAPESFLPTVQPLLDLRRAQDLAVRAVSVESITNEFGYGESRPEAIRDYLTFAYEEGPRPAPRYVLLAGDATYDFKDTLGTGVVNRVPPLMVKTTYLWTASDPGYATIHGDDPLPDLAIGRLPAADVDELARMVRKILDYETRMPSPEAPVVLIADDPDEAGDFESHVRDIASGVLAAKRPRTIFLSQLGVDATRHAILDAFDSGASMVSYVGHGGIHLWAQEDVLDIDAVDRLRPQDQMPVLLTFNCLNGYFHFPYFDSLAEKLLKADGRGALAAFSPSGLSLDGPAHRYQQALLAEWVSGRHQRLGDAVLAAQGVYADEGAFPELLAIYHLFGDPALTLR
jgi:Peptidase family C25